MAIIHRTTCFTTCTCIHVGGLRNKYDNWGRLDSDEYTNSDGHTKANGHTQANGDTNTAGAAYCNSHSHASTDGNPGSHSYAGADGNPSGRHGRHHCLDHR